jgi:hypothetical protein
MLQPSSSSVLMVLIADPPIVSQHPHLRAQLVIHSNVQRLILVQSIYEPYDILHEHAEPSIPHSLSTTALTPAGHPGPAAPKLLCTLLMPSGVLQLAI